MSDIGETTNLTPATTRSTSLRSTVPMSIVRQLGLTEKDKLNWQLKAENGEIIIIVRPIKDSGESQINNDGDSKSLQ